MTFSRSEKKLIISMIGDARDIATMEEDNLTSRNSFNENQKQILIKIMGKNYFKTESQLIKINARLKRLAKLEERILLLL